jgi:hypothetical protein
MKKLLEIPPIILFLLPIMVAIGLFAFLNPSCRAPGGETAGSLKLLYTSEVGGKLDPCG